MEFLFTAVYPANIVYLMLATVTWCFIHSFLISISVTSYLKKISGPHFRWMRLFYNLFSLFSFVALMWLESKTHSPLLFNWQGYWLLLQLVFLLISLFLFVQGARSYHMGQFLGIQQLRDKNTSSVLSAEGTFQISGILKYTRHPWYLGTLLIIWLRTLTVASVAVNLVFTVYLFIGILLEERKLMREFGRDYEAYRNRVPMLLPNPFKRQK